MHDFKIDPSYTLPNGEPAPPGPAIVLNNFTFYPSGPELGFTGLTEHRSLPVPWTTTVDDYLARPGMYKEAALVGSLSVLPVPNTHGWNLTCVILRTIAYGSTKENEFENGWSNVSAIEVFLQRTNVSHEDRLELRDVAHPREVWTLEWYQIITMDRLYGGDGINFNGSEASVKLPTGLRDKLLAKSAVPLQAQGPHNVSIGPWNSFQILLLVLGVMAAILGLAYIAAVVGTALLGSNQCVCVDRWLRAEGTKTEEEECLLIDEETGDHLWQGGVILA